MFKHLCLFLFSIVLFSACTDNGHTSTFQNQKPPTISEYANEQTCTSCHKEEVQEWQKSHHAKAMQIASKQSVLANLNTSFSADGMDYKFFTTDTSYWVTISESGQATNTYEITHTFGYTPLQQYLLAFPNGKLQVLRASWDTEKNTWFHQYAGENIASSSAVHYSNQSQNWNSMCSSCHSTNVHKNYYPAVDSFNTTHDMLTVGCQSCHGGMNAHQLYHNGQLSEKPQPSKVYQQSALAQTNNCGTCHARRTMLSDNSLTDSNFINSYIPQTLNANFYQVDGQIMEEDFVYGSFISSKMHQNHVSCNNCHNVHSNALKMEGNQLCLQCHESSFNTKAHTHHAMESAGGQCINCHMDGKTYMGNDYRRDHSFRVPRPHQSVEYGTSNSCISCHKNESNTWAAKNVEQWFGKPDTSHYSYHLIKTSLLSQQSLTYATLLLSDTATPSIIQATAVDYAGNLNSRESMQFLEKATRHTEPMVRLQAYSELINYPENIRIAYAPSALKSEHKAIRLMGFRLANGLQNQMSLKAKQYYTKVDSEYKAYLTGIADFANGQILWGEYYAANNDYELAKKHYALALKIDSLQPTAYTNLIIINSTQQRTKEVKKWIDLGLRKMPNYGEFYYFEGLYYSEIGNTTQQLQSLRKAYELVPENTKYIYNYLISEYQHGDKLKAQKIIKEVIYKYPNHPKIMQLNAYL